MRWIGLYSEFFRLLQRFWNQTITFPMLVVMGKQDYVFYRAAERFTASHENVKMVTIQDAGHICNIDQADTFNALGLRFLQRQVKFSNIACDPIPEPAPEYLKKEGPY